MNKILKLSINFVAIGAIVAALSVGNSILFSYSNEVSSLLSPPIVDHEAYELTSSEGQELSAQIMEEGAVLLRNENNTLPLSQSETPRVNVFGWHSVDWIYGSVGRNASGGVRPETDDFETNIDIYDALTDYGISYNEELYNFYFDYFTPYREDAVASSSHISTFMNLCEPAMSYYPNDLLLNAKEYSDTALVVISRMTGESGNPSDSVQSKEGPGSDTDYSRHYLEISTEEEELLTYVGANFENVIVIINSANVLELGFLETIEGIDACLHVGFTGTRAASAISGLLYGEYSPSGRTIDIYSYDLFTNPANYFRGQTYSDYSRTYVDYVEGIYVGYKWYETADYVGLWNSVSNEYGEGYEGVVQYPFGYGLSYTTFEYEVTDISLDPGESFDDSTEIEFTIIVTNTGEYSGKEVVELYVQAPYYSGQIEKSYVSLVAFGKTAELEPGANQVLTLTVDSYDFASYDCYDDNQNGFAGYELDQGTYSFRFQTDSHNVKQVTYEGEVIDGIFDFEVSETILIPEDPVTGKEISNLFTGSDAIDRTPIDATEKDGSWDPEIPWFSRASFPSVDEWEDLYVQRSVTPSAAVTTSTFFTSTDATAWDNATVDEFGNAIDTNAYPTWNANYGIMLMEGGVITEDGYQLGENYDDPLWDDVLDQLSFNEVISLINRYYGSAALSSVGKPALSDYDGPSQIKGFTDSPRGTGYPAISVLAATWNQRLAYDFGKSFGNEMKSLGVSGLWGWALDSHRSAWFGRNNESPSEDAYLSGIMISQAVQGLNKMGRYCTLKHFALYGNDGDAIWLTEQALRENYLKPFREAIVEGGALGIMTTYQGIGAEHSETTTALLTGVLRNEWDFKGMATTDYVYENSYADAFIRAGGDVGMGIYLGTVATYNQNTSTARLQNRLREVAKHVLYTWLHSAYNEQQYLLNPDDGDSYISSVTIRSWEWWIPTVYSIDIIVGTGLTLWAVLVLVYTYMKPDKVKKQEKSENEA